MEKKKKKKRKGASGPEEIRKEGKSPTSWLGKNLYQANMQAHEAIRRNIASSEAHGLHFMEDTHEQKRHIAKRDTTETTREQKKKKMLRIVKQAQKSQSTTYLYPTNIGEVGLQSRDLKGVVWCWGEKSLFWISSRNSFWVNALLGLHFAQKR